MTGNGAAAARIIIMITQACQCNNLDDRDLEARTDSEPRPRAGLGQALPVHWHDPKTRAAHSESGWQARSPLSESFQLELET